MAPIHSRYWPACCIRQLMQLIQMQGEYLRSADQGGRLHYLTVGLLWFADDTHSGLRAGIGCSLPVIHTYPHHSGAEPTFQASPRPQTPCAASPDGLGWRYDVRRVAQAQIAVAR